MCSLEYSAFCHQPLILRFLVLFAIQGMEMESTYCYIAAHQHKVRNKQCGERTIFPGTRFDFLHDGGVLVLQL
jgi:hypothetical protein